MRLIATVLGCCIVAAASSAVAKEFVIIASDNVNAELSPGTPLRAGQKLSLPKGAVLTILAESGKVIRLRGPYSGQLTEKSANGSGRSLQAVGKIVKRRTSQSPTIGATRSTRRHKKPAMPDILKNIWTVRLARSEPACVNIQESVLWRRSTRNDATVAIWPEAGTPRHIQWPSGQPTVRLPADALTSVQRLSVLEGGRSTDITVSILPTDFALVDRGRLLQWLAEKGCNDQARRLIVELHAGSAGRQ